MTRDDSDMKQTPPAEPRPTPVSPDAAHLENAYAGMPTEETAARPAAAPAAECVYWPIRKTKRT